MHEVFSLIKGQEQAVEQIESLLAKTPAPQSMLFVGPDGVGKFQTALSAAAALLAPPAETDMFGATPVSLVSVRERIAAHEHPDALIVDDRGIIEFDDAKDLPDFSDDDESAIKEQATISINVIHTLIDKMNVKPFEGGKRVVVIQDAERMARGTSSAVNAFLKTLEEPPPENYIILTTSRPDAMPATIASRCLRINFKPLAESLITDILTNEMGYEQSLAEDSARAAEGSIARARAIADRLPALRMLLDDVYTILAQRAANPEKLYGLGESVGKMSSDKTTLRLFFELLAASLRDIELISCGISERHAIFKNASEHAAALPPIAGAGFKKIYSLIDEARMRNDIFSIGARTLIENLLLQMTYVIHAPAAVAAKRT